jgi:hypothetical protein
MSEVFTTVEVRSTLRTLRDYVRDLLEARFDEFGTKLRLFVNFCEKDDVFRVIARHLHARAGNVREWFSAVAAGGAGDVPAGAAGLAHRYMTLAEIKRQGIDLRNFVSTLYSGAGGMTAAFAAFKTEFLEPFAKTLLAILDRIEEALAQDPAAKLDLDEAVARELAKADGQAPASAAAAEPLPAGKKQGPPVDPGAPIEMLLKSLEASVKAAKEVVEAKRKDLATDVKILKLALSKAEPSDEVALAVLRPLERIGGRIAEIASAIEAKLARAAKR